MVFWKLTAKRDFDRVAENGPNFILHQTLIDPGIHILVRILYGKFTIGQRVAGIQRRGYLLKHTQNISTKKIRIYYTIYLIAYIGLTVKKKNYSQFLR